MDYTAHGILQARILEWVAFPFSRASSQPRDQTQASPLRADSLPAEPPGESVFSQESQVQSQDTCPSTDLPFLASGQSCQALPRTVEEETKQRNGRNNKDESRCGWNRKRANKGENQWNPKLVFEKINKMVHFQLIRSRKIKGDFPGGPGIKTSCFHYREHRGLRSWTPHGASKTKTKGKEGKRQMACAETGQVLAPTTQPVACLPFACGKL